MRTQQNVVFTGTSKDKSFLFFTFSKRQRQPLFTCPSYLYTSPHYVLCKHVHAAIRERKQRAFIMVKNEVLTISDGSHFWYPMRPLPVLMVCRYTTTRIINLKKINKPLTEMPIALFSVVFPSTTSTAKLLRVKI